MPSSFLNEHTAALVGALAIHIGVGAWMIPSAPAPAEIKQQVIHISVLAPPAEVRQPTPLKAEAIPVAPAPPPSPETPVPVAAPKEETPPLLAAPPAPEVAKPTEKGVTAPKHKITKVKKKVVEVPKPEAAKPPEKPEPEKVTEPQRVATTTPPSGQQAPHATAARTDPIFNAAYLHNTPPAYPPPARRRGVQGKVTLEVHVNADGDADTIRLAHSSGSSLLDNAARDAVAHWRFVPARHGGEKVAAMVLVPIEFKLN